MLEPDAPNGASAVRASVTAVVGVLGAVALLLLLVTWAATIGPQQVVTGTGNSRTYASISPSTATAPPGNEGKTLPEGRGGRDVLFAVVAVVATLLATIVLLAVLLTVMYWLLTRTWRRQRHEPEPDEVEFDALDAPSRLAEALVAGAPSQRAALQSGSPRNAIVECWYRFEELAESSGVRRLPWETSSEFTLRLLDRVSADDPAVSELARLFRDARYSSHEVTEESRDRAIEALDRIHRSLGSSTGSR
jgi:hypothetical protein